MPQGWGYTPKEITIGIFTQETTKETCWLIVFFFLFAVARTPLTQTDLKSVIRQTHAEQSSTTV